MLEADAEAIAAVKGYFVPDDTLLVHESEKHGIGHEQHLFGGVVPHPFVKIKSITHRLVDETAELQDGWAPRFTERVRDVVLPGVKRPLGAEGKGQSRIASLTELERVIEKTPQQEIAA